MRILILNGPNLNLVGVRERGLYGETTYAGLQELVTATAEELGVAVSFFQSNHEGQLIDRLHAVRGQEAGVVFNPGGLSHTSVALLDAMLAIDVPVVEVHLTHLPRREGFRQVAITAAGAVARLEGFGVAGYGLALTGLVWRLRETAS
jgi:3-dehydroquinate dehydratase-2